MRCGTKTGTAQRKPSTLARERSFSADLARQLRTPLASLRLRLETEQLHSDRDHPLLAELLTDVERLQVRIDDLLTLARDTDRTREPYALSTVLRDTISRWTPRLADLNRQLVARESAWPWRDGWPTPRTSPWSWLTQGPGRSFTSPSARARTPSPASGHGMSGLEPTATPSPGADSAIKPLVLPGSTVNSQQPSMTLTMTRGATGG